MASIGIGFLGEPSLAALLEPVFGGLSHGIAVGLSVAIAFTLVTALHISIGEQVPKMLAIGHAERTARRVARPLNWFRASHRAGDEGTERDLQRDRPSLRGRPDRHRENATPPRT